MGRTTKTAEQAARSLNIVFSLALSIPRGLSLERRKPDPVSYATLQGDAIRPLNSELEEKMRRER
jgi:hypothetical protein